MDLQAPVKEQAWSLRVLVEGRARDPWARVEEQA